MRTLTDDKVYLLIFAEAESNVRHRLFAEAYRYSGQVETLIEDAYQDTIRDLPHAILSTVTTTDVRDICISAAHEGMVNFHKRGIA